VVCGAESEKQQQPQLDKALELSNDEKGRGGGGAHVEMPGPSLSGISKTEKIRVKSVKSHPGKRGRKSQPSLEGPPEFGGSGYFTLREERNLQTAGLSIKKVNR